MKDRLDRRAGRQIFDKEYTRSDGIGLVHIPKDTQNPIDIKLRQLAIASLDGRIDAKKEFFEKWAEALLGEINNLKYVKGRIKDLYLHTRDVYIKTRKGDVYIIPFDKVLSVSEREPA